MWSAPPQAFLGAAPRGFCSAFAPPLAAALCRRRPCAAAPAGRRRLGRRVVAARQSADAVPSVPSRPRTSPLGFAGTRRVVFFGMSGMYGTRDGRGGWHGFHWLV
jgi:hypothetical protein